MEKSNRLRPRVEQYGPVVRCPPPRCHPEVPSYISGLDPFPGTLAKGLVVDAASSSFFARNEFLIRRLFSLCGLVPVGAYMVVHLSTNSLLLLGPSKFQQAVNQIHMPGKALVVIEWAFIFLPILFHAVLGLVIIRGGLPNTNSYPLPGNVRYTLQRATGMIAFLFILGHVGHLHGWFHFEPWKSMIEGLGGARFKPYNASSTLSEAMQSSLIAKIFYAVGVLSCVFHLANGIWSAGIRWGAWTSPAAMRRASLACTGFGVLLAVVSVAAWIAPLLTDVDEAKRMEQAMIESRKNSGEVTDEEVKEKTGEQKNVSGSLRGDAGGK